MKFLDSKSLLEAIQNDMQSSQLTLQSVESSVLSFSMQLPLYLNTPQIKPMQNISSQINELELLNNIVLD